MRIEISIPDAIYADGERLVQRLNLSRSQLYADALREYLARHDEVAITAALDDVYSDDDAPSDDVIRMAGQETLRRVEW